MAESAPVRVLVVDDEPMIRRTLRITLRAHGYDVTEVATGEAALDQLATQPADLLLLDLMLPGISGVEVCERLREHSRLPILVLSAVDDEEAKVRALDAGADDYVTKPFGANELLARVRSVLRRADRTGDVPLGLDAHGVRVDLVRRQVRKDGVEIHLTPTEYELFRYLVLHPDQVITHQELLQQVFGPGYESASGNLRVYVAGLRKKLESDPSRPRLIVTEPGIGYRLRSGEDP